MLRVPLSRRAVCLPLLSCPLLSVPSFLSWKASPHSSLSSLLYFLAGSCQGRALPGQEREKALWGEERSRRPPLKLTLSGDAEASSKRPGGKPRLHVTCSGHPIFLLFGSRQTVLNSRDGGVHRHVCERTLQSNLERAVPCRCSLSVARILSKKDPGCSPQTFTEVNSCAQLTLGKVRMTGSRLSRTFTVSLGGRGRDKQNKGNQ